MKRPLDLAAAALVLALGLAVAIAADLATKYRGLYRACSGAKDAIIATCGRGCEEGP